MSRFSVCVNRGVLTNGKRDTSRDGCWIPVRSLPRHVAQQLGCDRDTARQSLSYDLSNGWRDTKNAQIESTRICTATVVTLPDGKVGLALLDF